MRVIVPIIEIFILKQFKRNIYFFDAQITWVELVFKSEPLKSYMPLLCVVSAHKSEIRKGWEIIFLEKKYIYKEETNENYRNNRRKKHIHYTIHYFWTLIANDSMKSYRFLYKNLYSHFSVFLFSFFSYIFFLFIAVIVFVQSKVCCTNLSIDD